MKHKYMKLKLFDIIPQQHYLSIDKYESVKKSMFNIEEYGDIYVIEYKGKVFSIDGHHRLYYLYEQGVKEVNVVCELSDNNHLLYQRLADESLTLGLNNIADLKSRFLNSYDEYKMKWIDKCQLLLLTENEKKKYISDPCRYSALPLYKEIRLNKKDVSVVHFEEFDSKMLNVHKRHQRFFRISHTLRNVSYVTVPGFSVKNCNIKNDINKIVCVINESYENISITKNEVYLMTKDRVFQSNLWKFIVDDSTGEEVALGICQYDEHVYEVVLDWVQVLPRYRGKGLGKMLVTHLLNDSPSDAKFASVSGDIDNVSSPERLYRSCGFVGNDVWHILS